MPTISVLARHSTSLSNQIFAPPRKAGFDIDTGSICGKFCIFLFGLVLVFSLSVIAIAYPTELPLFSKIFSGAGGFTPCPSFTHCSSSISANLGAATCHLSGEIMPKLRPTVTAHPPAEASLIALPHSRIKAMSHCIGNIGTDCDFLAAIVVSGSIAMPELSLPVPYAALCYFDALTQAGMLLASSRHFDKCPSCLTCRISGLNSQQKSQGRSLTLIFLFAANFGLIRAHFA